MVFSGKIHRGETKRHVVENTPHKAGKKKAKYLTFITPEMQMRVIKHALALCRKGVDPEKFRRTIARREQITERDVQKILNITLMQLRAENAQMRDGINQAVRDLVVTLEAISGILALAEEAGLAIWRAA